MYLNSLASFHSGSRQKAKVYGLPSILQKQAPTVSGNTLELILEIGGRQNDGNLKNAGLRNIQH
jgi:hypothetical protein